MFKNRTLIIIALIAIVNALGYGIVIPILYSYSKHYGLSDFQNGLLFAVFSLCAFIASPVIGRMSDKYGRKPLLTISIIGTVISLFMQAFAPNAMWLFLARMLDGLTAGNISVASAVISDTTTPENRAKGFGIIGASFGLGFVFGPAISAATVGTNMSLPFIIAGLITLVAVIMTMLYLPETNRHIGQIEHKKLFDFAALWHSLFDPNIGTTLLITFVYYLAFACSIVYGFQPFATKILGLSNVQISLLFVFFGVLGVVTQVTLVGRVTKMLGLKKAFSSGLFAIALSFILLFFTRTLVAFIAASFILGIASAVVQPLISTILSQETDEKSQGTIMGINSSYMSLGQIFGPIIGGIVATLSIPSIYLAGFIFAGICFYLSFYILRPHLQKQSAF